MRDNSHLPLEMQLLLAADFLASGYGITKESRQQIVNVLMLAKEWVQSPNRSLQIKELEMELGELRIDIVNLRERLEMAQD